MQVIEESDLRAEMKCQQILNGYIGRTQNRHTSLFIILWTVSSIGILLLPPALAL